MRWVWQGTHVNLLRHEEAIVFHALSPIFGRELDLKTSLRRDRPIDGAGATRRTTVVCRVSLATTHHFSHDLAVYPLSWHAAQVFI